MLSVRVPVWVNHGRNGRVRLCVKLLYQRSLNEISTTVLGPHMEHHLCVVTIAERVAVHTILVRRGVSDNLPFFIASEFPAIDAHLVPGNITRLDEPVCYVTVYFIVAQINNKRSVGDSFSVD